MATIFIRERRKVNEGEKKPRFRVVATEGTDLKIKTKHIRRIELEAIAKVINAEVVELPKGGEGEYGNRPA